MIWFSFLHSLKALRILAQNFSSYGNFILATQKPHIKYVWVQLLSAVLASTSSWPNILSTVSRRTNTAFYMPQSLFVNILPMLSYCVRVAKTWQIMYYIKYKQYIIYIKHMSFSPVNDSLIN